MPQTFAQDETLPPTDAATQTSASLADILLCLPTVSPEALAPALDTISSAFTNRQVFVAVPHAPDDQQHPASISVVPYAPDCAGLGWVLTAADYAAAAKLAVDRTVSAVILLSDAPKTGDAGFLHSLAAAVDTGGADLAIPRFQLSPNDGLVNAALLYPLSRSLFGADMRFPLPTNAAFSQRMAQRLGTSSQRLVAVNQGSAILWPVAEAAIAGFSVREIQAPIDSGPPSPPESDFNALFANVAASLFSDIEAKATFWQRARGLPTRSIPAAPVPTLEAAIVAPDILSMIENFQLAQNNLQEIWSLVLPPQSRLALKKLSQMSAAEFTMDPGLWARTVYDFALAFHLRTLNRNHLLGAMTPLYLAWVASHLRTVSDDADRAAQTIKQTAAAFETEKAYFVSRWRWPDRFNP